MLWPRLEPPDPGTDLLVVTLDEFAAADEAVAAGEVDVACPSVGFLDRCRPRCMCLSQYF